MSLGREVPFLRTSRRSRCFGGKVHKCETWNCLSCSALLHSILKPYVVVQKSHANGSGHSCHTKKSPSLCNSQSVARKYKMILARLKGRAIEHGSFRSCGSTAAFSGYGCGCCHTAGHAEMRKMKLPARPCSLRIPLESHRFHCGLTLQESKRWPCAGEISGVKKLRLCSFRWGTLVRRVFAQCAIFQRTPENFYNGIAWIVDLS